MVREPLFVPLDRVKAGALRHGLLVIQCPGRVPGAKVEVESLSFLGGCHLLWMEHRILVYQIQGNPPERYTAHAKFLGISGVRGWGPTPEIALRNFQRRFLEGYWAVFGYPERASCADSDPEFYKYGL